MPLPPLVRRFAIPSLVLAALALLAAALGYRVTEAMGLAELHATGHHRLDLYAASLQREIDKYAYLPATLGLAHPVMAMLEKPDAESVHAVDRYLEALNQAAGTLTIYVLDRGGRVLASSNWQRPDSYVGEDLSYRPYFKDAAAGRTGRFFGIGTTRGEPGYYLSSPLRADGAMTGVAVVKVGLEQLEQSWSTAEAPALVSDENRVVILASVPSWKFTTLRPLDEATRRQFEANLKYNARPLPELGLIPIRHQGEAAELVRLPPSPRAEKSVFPQSGPFLAQSAGLPGTPWMLTVLSPVATIRDFSRTISALAGLGTAFVAILLLMVGQRHRHMRERERNVALAQSNARLQEEVAERSRAEATLRAAQAELVHAGKLAVIGQLSAELAHELNQPLAALRTLSGNAVKFLERGDAEAAEGNLQRIAQLVDRMGALTSQLKSFARKSSGAPQPVPVRRAVEDALRLLEQRLRRTGVAVRNEVEGDDEDNVALCDANRLQQVLVNLIGNALDALQGRAAAALVLTSRRDGGRVRIEVRDNGPGMAETTLSHLFEPFFTTKEAGTGLGLGLAISAGIVRDFGGTLSGANHPEGGAVFVIDVPAARSGVTECVTP